MRGGFFAISCSKGVFLRESEGSHPRTDAQGDTFYRQQTVERLVPVGQTLDTRWNTEATEYNLLLPTRPAPSGRSVLMASLYEPITGSWLGEVEADDGTIAFVVGTRKLVSKGLGKALMRLTE